MQTTVQPRCPSHKMLFHKTVGTCIAIVLFTMGKGGKVQESELAALGDSLKKDIIDCTTDLDAERVSDLITAVSKHKVVSTEMLSTTMIGKTLTKCIKSLKRQKRTSPDDTAEALSKAISTAETTLGRWKKAADNEAKEAAKKEEEEVENADGLPSTVKTYHARLTKQQKEIYKDPPVLPPDHIHIEDKTYGLPKRDKQTGQLTFECGEDDDLKPLLRDFHPNRTPEEVLRAGAFGGTYFRPITSAVTNQRYNANDVLADTLDPKWIKGLDKKTMLVSSTYRTGVNKFNVKCGGSLGMWESSGWIADSDPYGWFQVSFTEEACSLWLPFNRCSCHTHFI